MCSKEVLKEATLLNLWKSCALTSKEQMKQMEGSGGLRMSPGSWGVPCCRLPRSPHANSIWEGWLHPKAKSTTEIYQHSLKISDVKNLMGVPAVAQQDGLCLCSAGTRVQSSARHSGLRIQHCHSCSLGCNCSSDLIPCPGTPHASGQPKKKKEKKKPQSFSTKLLVTFCQL